jgi:hypothetical protein
METPEVEYETAWRIDQAMPLAANGIETMNDAIAVAFDAQTLQKSINALLSLSVAELAELGIRSSAGWSLAAAQKDIRLKSADPSFLIPLLYRPFDFRWIWYSGHQGLISRPRREVMRHLVAKNNRALLVTRQTKEKVGGLVTNTVSAHKSFAAYDRTTTIPLYVYPETEDNPNKQADMPGLSPWSEGKDGRRPNLAPQFVEDMTKQLNLSFVSDGQGDLRETFGPEDVFHYVYALLHSPTYRSRYAEFLKIDFPRIPITSSLDLFRALVEKGGELVALHLLDSPTLAKPITRYPIAGPNVIDPGFPRYVAQGDPSPEDGKPVGAGRVYINKGDATATTRGQYFEGVPGELWDFWVGGYQPCQSWLRDRRGRTLSNEDIEHYEKMVVALQRTIRLMAEIDAAIPEWPIS